MAQGRARMFVNSGRHRPPCSSSIFFIVASTFHVPIDPSCARLLLSNPVSESIQSIIVGHNIFEFDYKVLKKQCRRENIYNHLVSADTGDTCPPRTRPGWNHREICGHTLVRLSQKKVAEV